MIKQKDQVLEVIAKLQEIHAEGRIENFHTEWRNEPVIAGRCGEFHNYIKYEPSPICNLTITISYFTRDACGMVRLKS